MSTMTTPRGGSTPQGDMSPRNQQKARARGLTSATGLVIGSIIGTGVAPADNPPLEPSAGS